ncbi:hypothetical protein PVAP13_4NG012650 [Panicum virgatum]|uniref:Uncharacterized protein n=1 Tax=Panicum virgatum TaxID=38727 RepID=A0A8T0T3I9_PANVG|nr:hypothetical protein PVAP13_4NG012650 [Panicum virgatum]
MHPGSCDEKDPDQLTHDPTAKALPHYPLLPLSPPDSLFFLPPSLADSLRRRACSLVLPDSRPRATALHPRRRRTPRPGPRFASAPCSARAARTPPRPHSTALVLAALRRQPRSARAPSASVALLCPARAPLVASLRPRSPSSDGGRAPPELAGSKGPPRRRRRDPAPSVRRGVRLPSLRPELRWSSAPTAPARAPPLPLLRAPVELRLCPAELRPLRFRPSAAGAPPLLRARAPPGLRPSAAPALRRASTATLRPRVVPCRVRASRAHSERRRPIGAARSAQFCRTQPSRINSEYSLFGMTPLSRS